MNPFAERRALPRLDREGNHAGMRVRIRPGYDVSVVNVSAGGALVEGPCRLMPGTIVDVQVTGPTGRIALRGLVTRCTISRLWAASIWYCGALAFDRRLPLPADGEVGESVLCEQLSGLALPRAVTSRIAR